MKYFFLIITLGLLSKSFSQETIQDKDFDQFSYGLGAGLEYGGMLGTNVSCYIVPNFAVFGGIGYSFPGAGYNVGIKSRLRSKKQKSMFSPYLLAMYGINAAIISKYKYTRGFKGYSGPSFGFGIDTGPRIGKNTFFSFSIIYPIRDPEIRDFDFYPITFGVGVKFVLSKHN